MGCYLSMEKGELRTTTIIDDLLKRGEPFSAREFLMKIIVLILIAGINLYTPYLPLAASTTAPSHSPSSPSGETLAQPEMRMLRLYSPKDLESCPLDKWGILDPGEWRRDMEGQVKREDGR